MGMQASDLDIVPYGLRVKETTLFPLHVLSAPPVIFPPGFSLNFPLIRQFWPMYTLPFTLSKVKSRTTQTQKQDLDYFLHVSNAGTKHA
jgi:hypothetical protein